ncbi:hypothetical protein [Stappia sediminis]|nr:hypothetical protein [Stappia sediminis]
MTVIETDKVRGGSTTPNHTMTKILIISLTLAVASLGFVAAVV